MKEELIIKVMQQMLPYLDNAQLKKLRQVMDRTLSHFDVADAQAKPEVDDNNCLVERFIAAKRIEGCSEKTLKYYQTTIAALVLSLEKNVRHILTEDLRLYLTEYQKKNQLSRVTIDNIRRILSSFFSWLEDEDYIIKSPVRRIHKVKTASSIKETYSDEDLERIGSILNRNVEIISVFFQHISELAIIAHHNARNGVSLVVVALELRERRLAPNADLGIILVDIVIHLRGVAHLDGVYQKHGHGRERRAEDVLSGFPVARVSLLAEPVKDPVASVKHDFRHVLF